MGNKHDIWSFVTVVVMAVIFFLAGAKYEQTTHVEEINNNWNDIEVKQAKIDQFENTADYNATFNLKAKELTEPCRRCSTKLSDYQVVLDSIEQFKGELVVPEINRNTK